MTENGPSTPTVSASVYVVSLTETGGVTIVGPSEVLQGDVRVALDDRQISLAFGTDLPPRLADLLDIAVAAYVADRLCIRRPRTALRSHVNEVWQRRITLKVPLRSPDVWSEARRARVEGLLAFLTDDAWHIELAPEPPERRFSEVQTNLFPDIPTGEVSAGLLSGGLDSLAGITAELANRPERTVVALSARTNRRIGAFQNEQVKTLIARFGPRLRHIQVAITLRDRERGAFDREETSQRTRGFLFQMLGAVTAIIAGIDVLHVYENGIGALNLPYAASQLGAQATRATNPLTVGMASDLLRDVAHQPVQVHLPHQFDTKAEMCAIFHDPYFHDLIQQTISCDNFPQRLKAKPQCGVCPSCLLSRQSLFSAGLRSADAPCRYRHDIYSLAGDDRIKRTYHFRVMSAQAATFSLALSASDPWKALLYQYPILVEVAHDHGVRHGSDSSGRIVSLVERYSNDWLKFWEEVRCPSTIA